MNELFQITETKPTKLQSARRALADAERELDERRGDATTYDYTAYERAVNRFTELVKAEELAEIERSKE